MGFEHNATDQEAVLALGSDVRPLTYPDSSILLMVMVQTT